jgi:hypothetical protein
MTPDDFESPSRRPVPAPAGHFCMTCEGFGRVPFDRKLSTTRNPIAVDLIIRCAECKADGSVRLPSPAAARGILEGRIL